MKFKFDSDQENQWNVRIIFDSERESQEWLNFLRLTGDIIEPDPFFNWEIHLNASPFDSSGSWGLSSKEIELAWQFIEIMENARA